MVSQRTRNLPTPRNASCGRMKITVLPGQLTGKRATSLNVTTKLSLGLPSPHQQDPQPPCHSLSTITQDRWHQSQLFHSMPAELLLSTQTGARQHQLRPHHCPPVLANCWFCLHICLHQPGSSLEKQWQYPEMHHCYFSHIPCSIQAFNKKFNPH